MNNYAIFNPKTEMYIKYNPDKKCYYKEKNINGACGWNCEEIANLFIKENLTEEWEIKSLDNDKKLNDNIDEKCYIIYNKNQNVFANCADGYNMYFLKIKNEFSKFSKKDAEGFIKVLGKDYNIYKYDEII